MTAIGLLVAVFGFVALFASATSVVDPPRLPMIHGRIGAVIGMFASLAIMTVGAQMFPHQ
jgi:hypothetical protein